MNVELTIKGEVEVLRLQPGDTLLVTLDPKARLSASEQETVRAALQREFPDVNVLMVQGLSLSVKR